MPTELEVTSDSALSDNRNGGQDIGQLGEDLEMGMELAPDMLYPRCRETYWCVIRILAWHQRHVAHREPISDAGACFSYLAPLSASSAGSPPNGTVGFAGLFPCFT
eukprot:4783916-Alexandrium_andersonii.AAC.1